MIDPSARVEAGAAIGSDVTIGPYCTIGADVRVGDGCARLDTSISRVTPRLVRGPLSIRLLRSARPRNQTVIAADPQHLRSEPIAIFAKTSP